MRVTVPGAVTAAMMAMAACAPVPQVQTVVAPESGLHEFHTFRLVQASNFVGNIEPGETHPAFVNSATSRALGAEIAADLERRGYQPSAGAPDVLVEYGAAVREDLDPTDWSYAYPWRPLDWRGWGPARNEATPAEYEQGAVIIDLVDARTNRLLWRGHAAADPSGDELSSIRRLDHTVDTILGRLPGLTVAMRH